MQVIYVMPSTSARAASFPRASDKVKFFTELKQILKRMKGEASLQICNSKLLSVSNLIK